MHAESDAWTYAAAQIPGGVFLDRFGSKLAYFLSITLWSLFTLLQGFATGLYSLLFLRFCLGVSEAPCFPTNSRVVSVWFPQTERAQATSIYTNTRRFDSRPSSRSNAHLCAPGRPRQPFHAATARSAI